MNDAAHPECPSRQHVPVKQFKSNLQEMVNAIVTFGVPKQRIIIIGPPPFSLRMFRAHRKDTSAVKISRSSGILASYCDSCKKVAESADVTYFDTAKIFRESERGERLLSDGLHLSSLGSQILAKYLEPLVTEKVKEFNSWNTIKQNFVPWNQFAKMSGKNKKRKVQLDG